jgi:hypothetical protein
MVVALGVDVPTRSLITVAHAPRRAARREALNRLSRPRGGSKARLEPLARSRNDAHERAPRMNEGGGRLGVWYRADAPATIEIRPRAVQHELTWGCWRRVPARVH